MFVNGRLAAELSSVAGLDSVVTLASHAQLLTTDSAALEPHLARTEPFDDRAFAALARAFATDGAFVRIPRDHSLERPIWLVFLSAPGAAPSASHPRFTVDRGGVESRDDLRSARDDRRRCPPLQPTHRDPRR